MPTDGRITSLGTVASLSSTDLVMVVSPGNASSGINYQATVQQIASYVAGTTAAGSDTQVQYNNGGVLGGSPALTWVGPNLRVGAVGTVGGLQVVGQTAGGVIFNAVASSAVWTFTLPSTAGTTNLPLVTDGLGTTSWTTLQPPGGGTGLTAYSTGDLLYASNATTLARLAAATANYILTSNASNLAPSWSSSILVLGSLTSNTSVVVTFKGSSDIYNTILGGGSGGDTYIRGNVATSRIIIGDQNTGDVLLSSSSGRVVVNATHTGTSISTASFVALGGAGFAGSIHAGGLISTLGSSVAISSNTTAPAGGNAGVGYKATSIANLGTFYGTGAPSIAVATGSIYQRTDGTSTIDRTYVNVSGATTGWIWVTSGYGFYQSGVRSSVSGTTATTTLVTITIPGNTLGSEGSIRATVLWGFGGTATKTISMAWAGTEILLNTPSTQLSARTQIQINNRGTTNSQVMAAASQVNWSLSASAVITTSVDTTANQNLIFRSQLSTTVGGEESAVESYLVEILRPV